MAYKGRFKPSNPKKYIGDPDNIIYRSLWERKMMKYCDNTDKVLKWASEEISIPYYNPVKNKVSRYYPDFYMEYINSAGQKKKVIIEVKPEKETRPPVYKRKTKSSLISEAMFATNQAKWKACEEFCLDNGLEFRIMTEKEIFK